MRHLFRFSAVTAFVLTSVNVFAQTNAVPLPAIKVPEPATILLALGGAAVAAGYSKFKKRR